MFLINQPLNLQPLSFEILHIKIYCGVEQLVARWAHNPKVACSSRAPATKEKPDIFMSGFFNGFRKNQGNK